jgi:hypothetical protein
MIHYRSRDRQGSRANVALVSLELRISTPSPPPLTPSTTTTDLSLIGTILVRNLMFDKRVAVRFTFDDWQTVSEVGAKWIRSVEPSPHPSASSLGPTSSVSCFVGPSSLVKRHDFDLFGFSLKLSDHLPRIASKALVRCISPSALNHPINTRSRCSASGSTYRVASGGITTTDRNTSPISA